MDDQTATQPVARRAAKRKAVKRPKDFWRRIRKPLAQSRLAKGFITSLFAQALRFVRLTNPPVAGSFVPTASYEADEPGIIALWHGQHPRLYIQANGHLWRWCRAARMPS
jgi:hypothetical protein